MKEEITQAQVQKSNIVSHLLSLVKNQLSGSIP